MQYNSRDLHAQGAHGRQSWSEPASFDDLLEKMTPTILQTLLCKMFCKRLMLPCTGRATANGTACDSIQQCACIPEFWIHCQISYCDLNNPECNFGNAMSTIMLTSCADIALGKHLQKCL